MLSAYCSSAPPRSLKARNATAPAGTSSTSSDSKVSSSGASASPVATARPSTRMPSSSATTAAPSEPPAPSSGSANASTGTVGEPGAVDVDPCERVRGQVVHRLLEGGDALDRARLERLAVPLQDGVRLGHRLPAVHLGVGCVLALQELGEGVLVVGLRQDDHRRLVRAGGRNVEDDERDLGPEDVPQLDALVEARLGGRLLQHVLEQPLAVGELLQQAGDGPPLVALEGRVHGDVGESARGHRRIGAAGCAGLAAPGRGHGERSGCEQS